MEFPSLQHAGATTPKHHGKEGRIVPAAHGCQRLMSLRRPDRDVPAADSCQCLTSFSNSTENTPKSLRKWSTQASNTRRPSHTKTPWQQRPESCLQPTAASAQCHFLTLQTILSEVASKMDVSSFQLAQNTMAVKAGSCLQPTAASA